MLERSALRSEPDIPKLMGTKGFFTLNDICAADYPSLRLGESLAPLSAAAHSGRS
jgi:hypothetical protein